MADRPGIDRPWLIAGRDAGFFFAKPKNEKRNAGFQGIEPVCGFARGDWIFHWILRNPALDIIGIR